MRGLFFHAQADAVAAPFAYEFLRVVDEGGAYGLGPQRLWPQAETVDLGAVGVGSPHLGGLAAVPQHFAAADGHVLTPGDEERTGTVAVPGESGRVV